MLNLKSINKTYKMSSFEVRALKDINLKFRKNEFVSILGPSGSGKTTLLNIIGGLDKYTSGDLVINGRSTKTFKERDWDVYRNHRIGFVFQSYNLIPHQTVLSNVELALTISGMSKEERIAKAKDALDKVGLADQYYKKPNQLSGGQSQRVAIARAIVNDPEILLADEPTGALDTKTSKQIMDLIQEIAKDRLVIMVTHNPELAEEYSTRIINLLDGQLLNDSNPIKENEKQPIITETKASEKAKMSWWTTFKLSLQNLFSKKNRTILTSVASSIGIIGISLVLALSFGVRLFISDMQEDMLSGNPITVETSTIDLEKMMSNMGMGEKIDYIKEDGLVNVQKLIEELSKRASNTEAMFVENKISEEYLTYLSNLPKEDVGTILYDYQIDMKPNLYLDFYENDNLSKKMSLTTILAIYTDILKQHEETKSFANLISNFTNITKQAPSDSSYILDQYDILEGKYATKKDEVMLVLGSDRTLNDLLLAQLGFYTQEEFTNIVFKEINDENYNNSVGIKDKFSYNELMNKTFTWYPNDAIYNKVPAPFNQKIKFLYNGYENEIVDKNNKLDLKIVGILEPKDNMMYGSLNSGFYYTEELASHILEINKNSEVVNYLKDKNLSSFSNIPKDLGANEGDMELESIMFKFDYNYKNEYIPEKYAFVGNPNMLSSMMGMMGSVGGGTSSGLDSIVTLSVRDLGGEELPSKISIYPKDLKHKEKVIKYLNDWNQIEGRIEEDKITLTDPLSLVFTMINDMIKIITIALIGFTTLALIVSSVMIAIITYVSVVERIKEIGVIRSLGGRKKDVSNLFIAETAIIGLTSGIIAISFTYLVSFIVNLIVNKRIGNNIAVFPFHYAIIMLAISIALTLISGLIPSRSAAKKDPVVALRTE